MDDHRTGVVFAESLFVTRDVNDSSVLVDEDWPNVEKPLGNAGSNKHLLGVDRVAIEEPDVLWEDASDGERVVIKMDVSVLGAFCEVEVKDFARELAWLFEGVMVWEIESIVIDRYLVILFNEEGVGADS